MRRENNRAPIRNSSYVTMAVAGSILILSALFLPGAVSAAAPKYACENDGVPVAGVTGSGLAGPITPGKPPSKRDNAALTPDRGKGVSPSGGITIKAGAAQIVQDAVAGPITDRPNQNAAITATRSGGNLVITGGGRRYPEPGRPIVRPAGPAGGGGSGGGGPGGPRPPPSGCDCNVPPPAGAQACSSTAAGISCPPDHHQVGPSGASNACWCEPNPTPIPTVTPRPTSTVPPPITRFNSTEHSGLAQPDWDDFQTSEEAEVAKQSSSTNNNNNAGGPSSFTGPSTRPDRGGEWFWMGTYPGYVVNLLVTAIGEELQIYTSGMRLTYAAIGNDQYRLVSESDASGNTTEYQYGANGKLLAKLLPEDLKVEYVERAAGQGTEVIIRTLRCMQPGHQNCQNIGQDQSYFYNQSGQLERITNPATPYVREPQAGAVHDLLNVQRDESHISFEYYPNRFLRRILTGVGSHQELIADYSYYAPGHPDAGKLFRVLDGNGQTTTYSYPAADRVTSVDADGNTIDAWFDSDERIERYRETANPNSAGGVPYVDTHYAYAESRQCDRVVSEIRVDPGTGTPVTQVTAEWDNLTTGLFRIFEANGSGA